jgi:hypothetical protein
MSERRPSDVICFNVPRIVPDEHGGWFVVRGAFGWLFGSRREALIAHRDLLQEARP